MLLAGGAGGGLRPRAAPAAGSRPQDTQRGKALPVQAGL